MRCVPLLRNLINRECKWPIMRTECKLSVSGTSISGEMFSHFTKSIKTRLVILDKPEFRLQCGPRLRSRPQEESVRKLGEHGEAPAPTSWVREVRRETEDTRLRAKFSSTELTFVWSMDTHWLGGDECTKICSAGPKTHLWKLDRFINLKNFLFTYLQSFENPLQAST